MKIQDHRLDFGGNPDLDPDPGILKEFYHCDIFKSKSSLRRLTDLILNKLKTDLAEVYDLRVPLVRGKR